MAGPAQRLQIAVHASQPRVHFDPSDEQTRRQQPSVSGQAMTPPSLLLMRVDGHSRQLRSSCRLVDKGMYEAGKHTQLLRWVGQNCMRLNLSRWWPPTPSFREVSTTKHCDRDQIG